MVAGVACLALFGGLIEVVDRSLYDSAVSWQARRQPTDPKPYVLVEIDDRSVEALGSFPWSRSTFSDLLRQTRVGGARAVGLDVVFSEAADSEGDAAFAEALDEAGNVVLASAPMLVAQSPVQRPGLSGDCRWRRASSSRSPRWREQPLEWGV